MVWPWWLSFGRERTLTTWSGFTVPAAVRMVPTPRLCALAEAAERDRLGWNAGGMELGAADVHFLLPYSYEERPVPLWKCRVIALSGGLSAQTAQTTRIRYGRLDVPLTTYRRLPAASRQAERQLLHRLARSAATAGR
jgi:hypothetical protein